MFKALTSAAVLFGIAAITVDSQGKDDGLGLAYASLKNEYRRPPGPPTSEGNLTTPAKVALGKALFFDPRLSGSNDISCASCHIPGYGWADSLAHSFGHAGKPLTRHTPTLLNLAWGEAFFWDGRAESLEEQALIPIQSPLEMAQDLDTLITELNAIESYRESFAEAFGGAEISAETIAKAIASFERTIISGETAFDRWIEGDEQAISEAAKRGFAIFNGKARCSHCHTGWNFTDHSFHDIGLDTDDLGRYTLLPIKSLKYTFKTPGLRNIAARAPYMHDGSIATLEDVIDHYAKNFLKRPSLSFDLEGFTLSPEEKRALLAFLETLSDDGEQIATYRQPD